MLHMNDLEYKRKKRPSEMVHRCVLYAHSLCSQKRKHVLKIPIMGRSAKLPSRLRIFNDDQLDTYLVGFMLKQS